MYATARSPFGPSSYFGYLADLKAAHPNMPVIIAEYGVPASFGIAHLQPQGWHHGGHSEDAMADIDVRLTEEIAAAGLAGGILFAWIDEWFKKNWITKPFEIPLERNRLWLNRLDAEQQYGIFAMEPGSGLPGRNLRDRASAWDRVPPLYESADGASLRAHADEAYLWLRFEGPMSRGRRVLPTELSLGFDTFDPTAGDRRWPGAVGAPLSAGLEFALRIDGEEARLLVDPPSNPFRLHPVREGVQVPTPVELDVRSTPRPAERRAGSTAVTHRPPRDLFSARREQRLNWPLRSTPNADGVYDSLRVITNRPRFGRDGTEFLAAGYDRGVLPAGPLPDGFWEVDGQLGVVEVRIPWMLLNFTDPSQRRVLQHLPEAVSRGSIGSEPGARWDAVSLGGLGTVRVPDIGIAARWSVEPQNREDDAFVSWPDGGADLARFTWDTWEEPRWRSRPRPIFGALKSVFRRLDALVLRPTEASLAEERR